MSDGIHAIVLAAGASRRFGTTKQLAEVGGRPLVGAALDVAEEVFGARVTLVLGHDWRAVYDACVPHRGFLVVNERHAEGMGTSIALSVRAVRHAAGAVVILLADQPRIPAAHLRTLVETWSGGTGDIVATAYGGISGPPVLFPPGAFDALAALSGDRGAKELLEDSRFRVTTVACEEAAVDIDTPEDLAMLR